MSMYNDIVWGEKEIQKDVDRNSPTVAEYVRKLFRGHIGHYLAAWIRKEMVRNLHRQTRRILGRNCREHDDEFSQISVIQNFVPPVPLREENGEAKGMARSPYTSTVAMKTSSCFSARCLEHEKKTHVSSQTYENRYSLEHKSLLSR